jgi:hypothetical protein
MSFLSLTIAQAVSDPQAWAKRKEQRGDMRKENKKRKVKSYA